MQLIDRVPNRMWIATGIVLALGGGVAAASAGSKGGNETAPAYQPSGQLLKLAFAAPPPLQMPAPAADQLEVLAPPPASLANLDPDVQQSTDYAALAASMKRYEALLAADAAASDARPPTFLTGGREPDAPVLAVATRTIPHEDDVAASGDTGRASAETPAAD